MEEKIKELKRKFEGSNKYMLTLSYEDIKELFVIIEKYKHKIEQIIQILEGRPYVAYTLYGDILHESDEIAEMLKDFLNKGE